MARFISGQTVYYVDPIGDINDPSTYEFYKVITLKEYKKYCRVKLQLSPAEITNHINGIRRIARKDKPVFIKSLADGDMGWMPSKEMFHCTKTLAVLYG